MNNKNNTQINEQPLSDQPRVRPSDMPLMSTGKQQQTTGALHKTYISRKVTKDAGAQSIYPEAISNKAGSSYITKSVEVIGDLNNLPLQTPQKLKDFSARFEKILNSLAPQETGSRRALSQEPKSTKGKTVGDFFNANEQAYRGYLEKIAQIYQVTYNASSSAADILKALQDSTKIRADGQMRSFNRLNIDKETLESNLLRTIKRAKVDISQEFIDDVKKSESTNSLSKSDTATGASTPQKNSLESVSAQEIDRVRGQLSTQIKQAQIDIAIDMLKKNVLILKDRASSPQELRNLEDQAKLLNALSIQIQENETLSQTIKSLRSSEPIKSLSNDYKLIKSLLDGYEQSVQIAENENYTAAVLQKVSADMSKQQHQEVMGDIVHLAQFPYERTRFLKESSDAQKEVFAQELRRAFAPMSAFKGLDNPYPKYRVTTTTSVQEQGPVPTLPEVRVSSKEIHFSKMIVPTLDKKIKGFSLGFRADDDAPTQSLKDIPGFASTMMLSKFLGDTDAKLGNIGVRLLENGQPILTNIDGGLCFKVDPSLFKDPQESASISLSTDAEVCHYLYQRLDWEHHSEFDNFFKQSMKSEQVLKETRLSALRFALFPPEAYKTFAQQYLSEDNSFLTNNDSNPDFFENDCSLESIINNHLIQKSQDIYQNFMNDDVLFQYFIEPAEGQASPVVNIFQEFQDFQAQMASFLFYKDRGFDEALGGSGNMGEMMEKRFTQFIKEKLTQNPEYLPQIAQLLQDWDPHQVYTHIEHKDTEKSARRTQAIQGEAIEKGMIFKHQMSQILKELKQQQSCDIAATSRVNSPEKASGNKRILSSLSPREGTREPLKRADSATSTLTASSSGSSLASSDILSRGPSSLLEKKLDPIGVRPQTTDSPPKTSIAIPCSPPRSIHSRSLVPLKRGTLPPLPDKRHL